VSYHTLLFLLFIFCVTESPPNWKEFFSLTVFPLTELKFRSAKGSRAGKRARNWKAKGPALQSRWRRITPGSWEKLSGTATANCELNSTSSGDWRESTDDWEPHVEEVGWRLKAKSESISQKRRHKRAALAIKVRFLGGLRTASFELRVASCRQLVPSCRLRDTISSCQESRIRRYLAAWSKPIVALDAGVAAAANCTLHSTNLATNAAFGSSSMARSSAFQ